jgi:excisionase family DNA binding protein
MDRLTVAEVATRLRVTPLTVRLWLNAGSLTGSQCHDRANCRIRERDLATFLAARCRGGVQVRTPRSLPIP